MPGTTSASVFSGASSSGILAWLLAATLPLRITFQFPMWTSCEWLIASRQRRQWSTQIRRICKTVWACPSFWDHTSLDGFWPSSISIDTSISPFCSLIDRSLFIGSYNIPISPMSSNIVQPTPLRAMHNWAILEFGFSLLRPATYRGTLGNEPWPDSAFVTLDLGAIR